MTIETIIRPFQTPDVTPTPFRTPGQQGSPLVKIAIGQRGGTKTFTWSFSASISAKMGQAHKEKAPTSQSLQNRLAKLADSASGGGGGG